MHHTIEFVDDGTHPDGKVFRAYLEGKYYLATVVSTHYYELTRICSITKYTTPVTQSNIRTEFDKIRSGAKAVHRNENDLKIFINRISEASRSSAEERAAQAAVTTQPQVATTPLYTATVINSQNARPVSDSTLSFLEIRTCLTGKGYDCSNLPEFPSYLCCPISTTLMFDPVILGNTGYTFDRLNIVTSLSLKPGINPLTNERISNSEIKPNFAIREAILAEINKLPNLSYEETVGRKI